AKERLGRVPVFLRGMVKKGVERYAAASGIRVITPDVMSELRKRAGR
ncbi:MAG TPA: PCP reductase family protein, partial [Thermodesulfobacteriota bacterium]|nr:PCP reductase family protein [Thermodesulfobacteriota bacterium]